MIQSSSSSTKVTLLALASLAVTTLAQEQCFPSNPEFEATFATDNPTCCQFDVCGLPCPAEVERPTKGFGIAIIIAIVVSFLIGFATLFLVQGEAENFFIAGKSLPLWIVAFTLGAQSIDSNALLGNADLSYKYHFWDGACLPIGLGLSLILNGIFLARHINNEENVLTLPDILARRYGKLNEILISIITIISFMMLLAGNLVGMGVILAYVWDIEEAAGIWISASIVWGYTVSGGLFSVAYTDVAQGLIGWSGAAVTAYYLMAKEEPRAPPPSIGFPGYIYPDNVGDGGVCDMYEGVACSSDPTLCCYNADLWCPTDDNCTADNGAYPIGDEPIFWNQMFNYLALTPFPNAIYWNWCTVFILGFGNLAALDFQARCMAAKTPSIATWGCIIGGLFTFFVGLPFASLGSITRVYYGPDSIHASFTTDTCSEILGLPTCGAWEPDASAFIKLLTHQAPPFLGGWCLFGIVAASMSTADGAILAMGTVFSHNVVRQLDSFVPNLVTAENLLTVTRCATVPLTLSAALIAAYYQSDNPAGATGYLLIVAFDVVLATVVVPLFGCFYTKNPSPRATFLSVICGAVTRIVMEFALDKDGYLLLPYNVPEFENYGVAASDKLPVFIDANATDVWDPVEEPCVQDLYRDYTGVDSLTALVVSFVVFVGVQFLEHSMGGPLFNLPGLEPYEKNLHSDKLDEPETKQVEEPVEEAPAEEAE
eukprot:Nitzschia sp. Nitz4//scaffold243_size29414//16856//19408//NITZ4_008060-RA/size29414-augustus-gene-0.13-mRNA-1//-1//CDS//3329543843//5945//frame0